MSGEELSTVLVTDIQCHLARALVASTVLILTASTVGEGPEDSNVTEGMGGTFLEMTGATIGDCVRSTARRNGPRMDVVVELTTGEPFSSRGACHVSSTRVGSVW